MPIDDRMIWCDLETTGLQDNALILEYAFAITDLECNIIDDRTSAVWTTPRYDEMWREMKHSVSPTQQYVYNMHEKSGLWEHARSYGLDPFAAQVDIIDWLNSHGVKGEEPLCGNSVHQDRVWLRHTWPGVDAKFHYRIVDVSTLKELCNRYDPITKDSKPQKDLGHRALDDLYETINEFNHYRIKGFFRDSIHRNF